MEENDPAWLFKHMKALSAAIIEVIVEDFGTDEVLRRLSDPYWFQALGCVIGFDWHSSGVTTTVCGALKEGLAEIGPEAGLFLAGGKGRAAFAVLPQEIVDLADRYPIHGKAEDLIYASRMAAKVDSSAVQDGYQIYHHFFVFTQSGNWAVIQQGMNEELRQARRYHWLVPRSQISPLNLTMPSAVIRLMKPSIWFPCKMNRYAVCQPSWPVNPRIGY